MDSFAAAKDQVSQLQEQHAKLASSIPRLQEIENQLSNNITTLKRQEANLVLHLDKLQSEITRRTEAFNTWYLAENKELTSFKINTEQQHKASTEKLDAIAKDLEAKAASLKTTEAELSESRNEVIIRQRINRSTEQRLKEQAAKLSHDKIANINLGNELSTKEDKLAARELKVVENEKNSAVALKIAEQDRSAAATLLDNAKDKIAATETKERSLDKREVSLKLKEKELANLSVQLNDQRQVIETNTRNML